MLRSLPGSCVDWSHTCKAPECMPAKFQPLSSVRAFSMVGEHLSVFDSWMPAAKNKIFGSRTQLAVRCCRPSSRSVPQSYLEKWIPTRPRPSARACLAGAPRRRGVHAHAVRRVVVDKWCGYDGRRTKNISRSTPCCQAPTWATAASGYILSQPNFLEAWAACCGFSVSNTFRRHSRVCPRAVYVLHVSQLVSSIAQRLLKSALRRLLFLTRMRSLCRFFRNWEYRQVLRQKMIKEKKDGDGRGAHFIQRFRQMAVRCDGGSLQSKGVLPTRVQARRGTNDARQTLTVPRWGVFTRSSMCTSEQKIPPWAMHRDG